MERARAFSVVDDPRVYLRAEVGARIDPRETRWWALTGAQERLALPEDLRTSGPCGEGRQCFEWVLGPKALDGAREVGFTVAALDHESSARLERVAAGGYELDVELLDENRRARIRLSADPLDAALLDEPSAPGRPPFPRSYEVAMRPGPCSAPFDEADYAEAAPLPVEVEPRFDDEALACFGLRPVRPRPGPAVATRTVPARAIARRFAHTYLPPVVSAPLVFLPVFDVEIPNPERCQQTQEALEAAVRSVALDITRADRQGAPVLGLAPIQVARADGVACRQTSGRRFDGAAEAMARRSALAEAGLDPDGVRVLVLYAYNLPLPVPPGLRLDLRALLEALGPPGERAYLVTLGDEGVLSELDPDGRLAWTSTLEPTFRDRLDPVLSDAWPFQTVLHDEATVVPMTDGAGAAGLSAFRICRSRPTVLPLGVDLGDRAFDPGREGPAYRVALPEQRLIPARSLTRASVEVEWEGCYALCERPGPGRTAGISWLREDSCPP
mgnify:CR=1 FL=1